LALVVEPEDAHDSCGHLEPGATRSHSTQCADVLVVAEHVLFCEHKTESRDLLEEVQHFVTATIVACQRVFARHVPDHVWVDEVCDGGEVTGAEGGRCPTIGGGIGMLVAGGRLGCHIVMVTHSARPGRGRRVMGAGDDRAVSVAVLRSGPLHLPPIRREVWST
jgi:hypothetical protein